MAIAGCAAVPARAASSQISAPPQAQGTEAAALADGWARLSKGDAAGAAAIAAQALAREPLSAAAAALAVDAELARGGTVAGLDAYEKWLGSRRLDDGYVLRRVARALLREASTGKQAGPPRVEALQALAADGDADAIAALQSAASSGSYGETRALAALGNPRAVADLIAQLNAGPEKSPIIRALAASGSKQAVRPLIAVLSDPRDVNRAEAADALGRLGATEAVVPLKALLNDQVLAVRLKVAGALLRLNDSSGVPLLSELAQSEHAAIRIAAARELEAQPDAAWQGMVRVLASDPDPVVRLEAARLIAPYDQPLARRVLDDLLLHDNLAVRDAASGVMVDRVANDFVTLRLLLRSADLAVRVKAAARVLELTR